MIEKIKHFIAQLNVTFLKKFLQECSFFVGLFIVGVFLTVLTYPRVALAVLGVSDSPQAVAFSGIAAIVLFGSVCLLIWRTSLWGLFPRLKLSELLSSLLPAEKARLLGQIAIAIALMLAGIAAHAQTAAPRHIRIAEGYVGIHETPKNSNRGPEIDQFSRHLGVPLGSSYCASFGSFVLDSARVSYPVIRSAVATQFITDKSIPAKDVLMGRVQLQGGEIAIWRNGYSWQGHFGFVKTQLSLSSLRTIEANTSPSAAGSQRDGGGIYLKTRTIVPTDHFRIIYFTPVYYDAQTSALPAASPGGLARGNVPTGTGIYPPCPG